MKSSFARRQPRKIGEDNDEAGSESGQNTQARDDQEQSPTVVRPSITSRGLSKTKKRSSLRTSFGPGGTSMIEDDENGGSAVFTPKKTNLSRQVVEKNALRKTLTAHISADRVPLRQSDERPSYSSEYLNELRTSTPTTPKDSGSRSDVEDQGKTLDLAAKFGSDPIIQDSNSVIPTDAEIREKKERRARLAKEQDFISLEDVGGGAVEDQESDESNDERSILPYAQRVSAKKEETRLVQDDENIAEGFDEFVSDGRIALGKKAEREQKKRQEAEIRNMIDEAEGGSDDSSDDSENERRAAYEAAQTRKGMEGLHRDEERVKPRRPTTPPKITPLPTINGCLEALKEQLAAKQYSLGLKQRRLEEIQKERDDIRTRQSEVQRLLKETGERYEKLSAEVDAKRQDEDISGNEIVVNTNGITERGLETLGNG
ncbi:hypothetical protein ACLMJK_006929 [Lecanora helva]